VELPLERLIITAGTLAAIALLLANLLLWSRTASYYSNYVEGQAVELAESFLLGRPVGLTLEIYRENLTALITVSLPNEEPILLVEPYSSFKLLLPREAGYAVLAGREGGYSEPGVFVFEAGRYVYAVVKPYANHTVQDLGGRRLHRVTVKLFSLEAPSYPKGSKLARLRTYSDEYCRVYDYEGWVAVMINGEAVVRFKVDKGDMLRFVVVREVWGLKS